MRHCFVPIPACTFVLTVLLSGCDSTTGVLITDPDNTPSTENPSKEIADNHQQGSLNYSTATDGIWPPQPVDIQNIQAFTTTQAVESDRDIKRADALTIVLNDPKILTLIGSRYEVIGQTVSNGTKGQSASTRVEIYSYSFNRVVSVTIAAHNRTTTKIQNASKYQPAETAHEVKRAIELAATQLLLLGHPTDQLIGTGLLAHPTTEEFQRDGNLFYDHRILYVTFGRADGSTPLFRANVDLTTETVHNAGAL